MTAPVKQDPRSHDFLPPRSPNALPRSAPEHASAPHALAERVTEAIQQQDMRRRGGESSHELLELRRALAALLDVLGRAMPMAQPVMARDDYDRLAAEIAAVAWAAARHEGSGADALLLARRVTTVTIRLAVVVTLAG